MAMVMDSFPELEVDLAGSGDGCNWDQYWSPLLHWDSFTDSGDDLDRLLMELESESHPTMVEEELEDSKGLRVVHLLMAAAEAVSSAQEKRVLAGVILVRLKELVSTVEGSNMERVAAYFTEALEGLLESESGNINNNNNMIPKASEMVSAFQLLQDMSPYVKLGHFTANQGMMEAVAEERRIHIVDYDIMEGVQWASLLQALASRNDSPHLRITALSRGGRSMVSTVQETGRRLSAFAASLSQPFSFHQCRLEPDQVFRPSAVKLVRGEALVFNCMLHMPHQPHRTPDSVASFLQGGKTLNAKLVALVEEEIITNNNHHNNAGELGFVSHFMDCLHHYSALYDSLQAGGFPMHHGARALVERLFLGPRIASTLANIYRNNTNGKEKERSWGEWLFEEGYTGVPISFANHCQAKLLLGLFNHGFGVQDSRTNHLLLTWKSKPLLSASLWTTTHHHQYQ